MVDAICYGLRTGCQWRALPQENPPWQTVYHYYRELRLDGMWECLNDDLREDVRARAVRNRQPSAASLESQPAGPTAKEASELRRDQKLGGRKRHLFVDTLAFLLRAVVHAADFIDHD